MPIYSLVYTISGRFALYSFFFYIPVHTIENLNSFLRQNQLLTGENPVFVRQIIKLADFF